MYDLSKRRRFSFQSQKKSSELYKIALYILQSETVRIYIPRMKTYIFTERRRKTKSFCRFSNHTKTSID